MAPWINGSKLTACSSFHFLHNQLVRLNRITVFILLGCSAILIAVVISRSSARRSEPVYQGKTLSEWLDVYALAGSERVPWEQRAHAIDAIRAMGTNALTNLLAWIRYEPADWQNQLESVIQPDGFTRYLQPLTYNNRQMWRGVAAQRGFEILGPIASPAIPELTAVINDTNAHFSAPLALSALAHLGEDAIPPIMRVLTNANHFQHRRASWVVNKMDYLGESAAPLIPVLIEHTKSPNSGIAEDAIQALGNLLLLPEISVPALTNSLTHSDRNIRAWAVRSLREFESSARPAIPALIVARSDPDYLVRDLATDALRAIAPDVVTNAPPQ